MLISTGLDQFIGSGRFLPTVIMFLEYGLAVASSTYCLTFFFSDHSMAQVRNILSFLIWWLDIQIFSLYFHAYHCFHPCRMWFSLSTFLQGSFLWLYLSLWVLWRRLQVQILFSRLILYFLFQFSLRQERENASHVHFWLLNLENAHKISLSKWDCFGRLVNYKGKSLVYNA